MARDTMSCFGQRAAAISRSPKIGDATAGGLNDGNVGETTEIAARDSDWRCGQDVPYNSVMAFIATLYAGVRSGL